MVSILRILINLVLNPYVYGSWSTVDTMVLYYNMAYPMSIGAFSLFFTEPCLCPKKIPITLKSWKAIHNVIIRPHKFLVLDFQP